MPITLDVSEAFAETVEPGQDIALRDAEGVILAILSISDKWVPNKAREAEKVFGADDIAHPAVYYLHHTRARSIWAGRSPASSRRCITISAPAATRRTSCAPISASSAGAASWPSRRATRCTARTRN
jgi:hypothetical protein